LLTAQHKKITIAAYNPQRLQNFLSQQIDTSHITFVTEIPKGIRSRIAYIRQGKYKERKLYKNIDAVIIGGGEILTEENKHSYRYRLVSLLPCLHKPRYLMGGIQLPKKIFNRFLFKKILADTKRIFARDQETVEKLKAFGIKHVQFFMDTAYYAYDRKTLQKPQVTTKRGRPTKQKPLHTNKYIIVNVNKNAQHFLPEIINDVKAYYQK
jgi:polysaccharide pyruvyl transferase WcaK-like protein